MLINQNELETLCLDPKALDDLSAQVINQLNSGKLSPLRRYATARSLLRVFETVCSETGAAGEYFCEQEDVGTDGKHFCEDEMEFSRQFVMDYNYSDNDSYKPEGSDTYIPYVPTFSYLEREVVRTKKLHEVAKQNLKARKTAIELEHPNMVPNLARVVLKFEGVKTVDS